MSTTVSVPLGSIDEVHEILKTYKEKVLLDISRYELLHREMQQKPEYQYDGTGLTAINPKSSQEYEPPDIKIVNVVVSTNIKEIDVELVKRDINTEYYPKQFPGFVHRMYNPKAAILLFKTGRLICTGIKNIEDAYSSVDTFTKKFDCRLSTGEEGEIKVQNLVISVDFGYLIDLEEAAFAIPRAIYESEQFPGIIYRHLDPRAVFLIFTSGKTICVGTNELKSAYEAAYYIRRILIERDLFIEREQESNR